MRKGQVSGNLEEQECQPAEQRTREQQRGYRNWIFAPKLDFNFSNGGLVNIEVLDLVQHSWGSSWWLYCTTDALEQPNKHWQIDNGLLKQLYTAGAPDLRMGAWKYWLCWCVSGIIIIDPCQGRKSCLEGVTINVILLDDILSPWSLKFVKGKILEAVETDTAINLSEGKVIENFKTAQNKWLI